MSVSNEKRCNSKSNEKLPNSFIKEYYIFTAGKYISVSEFIIWLGITRNTFIETLLAKFKKNQDYFIVNYEDEMKELKITSQSNYKKRLTQKYYLITTNCFKEYCTRSLTNKGNLVRKYYFKLDELFKEFHLEYIEKSDIENKKLLNNQKKNYKKILGESGIYVWVNSEKNIGKFRIGCTDNVYGRINQHNSSNVNKINVKIIVYTNYYKVFEELLKIYLEKYLYRGEFYKCDISVIEKNIKSIVNFLKKTKNDCGFKNKPIEKFYKTNKSKYDIKTKTLKKKSSKQTNKKSSKKISKQSSKKSTKKISKKTGKK